MGYRKEGKLKYRIVNKDNIIEIASYFEELCKEDGIASFTVYFYDNSSISGDTAEIFKSRVLRRKDAKRIHFRYSSAMYNNEIEVTLAESHLFSEVLNVYEVYSTDEKFYNATLQKLEDILSGIRKRSIYRRFWGVPLCVANYILCFIVTNIIMSLIGFTYGKPPENTIIHLPFELKPTEDAVLFISNRFLVFFTVFVFAMIAVAINFLYPEMEFDFNSHRYINRKKWKTAIWWIFTAIALPVIIGAFLNMVC